ncbi:hypothetical protein [Nostoc sp. JL33]|uniref:hypothetical protein n=1 Tax=Nostoc sp. JL33 TaxID=2815396 RepID=UPI0025E90623|nr:hypothetical protein [Nostoc sp. JL33]MBN3872266.1 hypothetical protein [Nostoc sp. JL33]
MADNPLVCTFPLITLEPNQLNLFSNLTVTPARKAETLVMNLEALLKCKSQILDYQQKVRERQPPQQTTLFNLTPKQCDPDQIDPMRLRLVPMSFYRMPVDRSGSACLYFIIDSGLISLSWCHRLDCEIDGILFLHKLFYPNRDTSYDTQFIFTATWRNYF